MFYCQMLNLWCCSLTFTPSVFFSQWVDFFFYYSWQNTEEANIRAQGINIKEGIKKNPQKLSECSDVNLRSELERSFKQEKKEIVQLHEMFTLKAAWSHEDKHEINKSILSTKFGSQYLLITICHLGRSWRYIAFYGNNQWPYILVPIVVSCCYFIENTQTD